MASCCTPRLVSMKIAAFDFDGTLHHPDEPKGFSPADLAAIRAWREAGHLAISATGRSRSALAYGMRGSTLAFDYQVLSNGASAATGDNRELIFGYTIDPDVLLAAIDTFGERAGLAIYGTTIGPIDGVFADNTSGVSHFTEHFTPMTRADIPEHQFAVVPIWVPTDEALRREVVAWGESLAGNYTVAQNQQYVDIMAPGRTKGAGILELLARLGIDRANVELFTFGDSWNDMSMHTIADHSHSFTHSPADVRAATDHVIRRVADALSPR